MSIETDTFAEIFLSLCGKRVYQPALFLIKGVNDLDLHSRLLSLLLVKSDTWLTIQGGGLNPSWVNLHSRMGMLYF